MADAPLPPAAEPSPDRIRFAARMRFNPQVLVFAVAAFVAWPAVVGLIVSGVHVIWGGSFRQVDYTMQRAEANDGSPYIGGTLAATGTEHLIAARMSGGRFLAGDRGEEPYEPGKTIKVWWSTGAPDLLIQGQRTNGVPVAALPERPGVGAFAGYLAWLVVVIVIGARVAQWIARRTARWQDVTITN